MLIYMSVLLFLANLSLGHSVMHPHTVHTYNSIPLSLPLLSLPPPLVPLSLPSLSPPLSPSRFTLSPFPLSTSLLPSSLPPPLVPLSLSLPSLHLSPPLLSPSPSHPTLSPFPLSSPPLSRGHASRSDSTHCTVTRPS